MTLSTSSALDRARAAAVGALQRLPVRVRVPWERRTEPTSTRRKTAMAVGAGGLAALIALFLDVRTGTARLHRAADRSRAVAKRSSRRVRSRTAYANGRARGRVARLRGLGTPTPVDDVEVKNQVRQVLTRHGFHRADVLVDVCDGMATLRGELSSVEEIDLAESLVREVVGVEGLVHLMPLPGTPAPNKVQALRAG
jgi:hypothetical protein